MPNRKLVLVGLIAAAALFAAYLNAQDPDGGAARGRALAAYRPAVPGVHGLVTAGHPLAAMAGLQVLMKGGNAVDAAVAVGTTLNMMEPQMNGVGGNGFMTVYEKKTGKVYALAMAGAAPKAIDGAKMTPETLDWGIDAGVVPGNFGGYLTALQRFGTMSIAQTFSSAIDYAANGYPIDASLSVAIDRAKSRLATFPTTAHVFLPGGSAPKPGEKWANPDLAATLRKAVDAEAGALKAGKGRSAAIDAAFDRFYKGDIAKEFDRFFRENRGAMTAADLAAYKPQWLEPLHVNYRGYDVFSSPASSRGGFELEMALNLVEGFDLSKLGVGSAESLHLMIEAIKISKADIYRYVADPKTTQIRVVSLLSKAYADNRRKLIDLKKVAAYPPAGTPVSVSSDSPALFAALHPPSGAKPFPDNYETERDTTSFSIVDQYGNAVSCTPTLGGGFGAGVVVGNTGLLLNNGMRLGSTSPYPDNVNYVRGGQIPLLNNSPSMVLKDGKLFMAYGTPGGETIGQTQFQMLVNVLDFHLPVQQAVESPRFALDAKPNFYKPGSEISVTIENRFPEASLKALQSMGHHLAITSGFTAAVGGMQAIVIDPATGTMMAGADPRRTGYAVGW